MPATILDPASTTPPVALHPPRQQPPGAGPSRIRSRWCFLLGLGGMTFVKLIGYLAFTEVYLLLTAPWRFGRFLPLITKGTAGVFSLLWLGWMLAAITSDLTNHVLLELLARGVSRAVLTGVVTLSIFIVCYPSIKRLEWLLLGLPVSMVVSLFYFRPGQADTFGATFDDILKFDTSLNYILTAAVIAASAWLYERLPLAVIAGLFACSPLYIALGSRSMGGVFFLAAVTTLAFRLVQTRGRVRTKVGFARLSVIAAVAAVGLTGLKYGYEYAAENRLLSEKHLRKYDEEKQAKGGVFVGSRGVFILTGIIAWMDKPLLGHGSWPEDTAGYYAQASEIVERRGVETRVQKIGGKTIRRLLPVHSQMFGALVEHGVLAFAFFAFMAWLILWSITFVPALLPRYTALFAVLYWVNLWNLVASPQGHRVPMAAGWAFFLLAYAYRAERKRESLGTIRRRSIAMLSDHEAAAPAVREAA